MEGKNRTATPFALACSTCNGAMAFNIIEGHYNCPFCGNEEFPNAEKARIEEWAGEQKKLIEQEGAKSTDLMCKGCGARVHTSADSATLRCSFCGNVFVRQELLASKNFPLALIPFAITESEARDIFKKWLSANSKSKFKVLQGQENSIKGIYLPYQLFQGAVSFTASRESTFTDRVFDGATFINHKAIVTSRNLPNDLLDFIEPFDWSALKDFHLGYLVGLAAKTEDNDYSGAEYDLRQEFNADIYEYVKDTLKTPYINTNPNLINVSHIPILLPIYYFKHKNIQVAINGQTGKVGVYTSDVKKSIPWIIEPIIVSILLFAAMMGVMIAIESVNPGGAFREGNLLKMLEVAGPFAGLLSLPIFIGYRDIHEPILLKRFSGSNEQLKRNIATKKLIVNTSAVAAKEDIAPPVFYDYYNGERVPVEYNFTPPARKLSIALMFAAIILAPLLLALALYPLFDPDNLAPFMGQTWLIGVAGWQILALPVAMILWMRLVRQNLYDYPFIRPVAGGSWRLVQDATSVKERWLQFFQLIRYLGGIGIFFVGFIIFFLFGAAFAMILKL